MSQLSCKRGDIRYLVYYHAVSDRQLPHLKYLVHMKSSRELEADLDYLGRHFEFISLAQFQAMLHTKQQGKRKLVLTFDDGYSEVYDIVQPILVKKGIPAAFFLVSNFLDNKELFYRCKASIICDFLDKKILTPSHLNLISGIINIAMKSKYDLHSILVSLRYDNRSIIDHIAEVLGINFQDYLAQYRPYLSQEQVQSFLDSGFEIGAHSIDHPFFGKVPLVEQLRQTTESMDYIQQAFHLPYRYFAIPHSDSGISAEYFYHVRNKIDLLLGGYGMDAYPINNYYQRFSLEKYQIPPYFAWQVELLKIKLKRNFSV